MKTRSILTTALLTTALLAPAAYAANATRPGPQDSRIRTVTYQARNVTQIQGHYGFTTSIEFAKGESIETVSLGDSEAWQVVKPAQENLLFVKPLELKGDTNMTVVTNKRLYSFMLFANQATSHQARNLIFHVQFQYPEDAVEVILFNEAQRKAANDRKEQQTVSVSPVAPEAWNFSYEYDGSEAIRPHRVFDDGKFTYFKFDDTIDSPAIFAVDAKGNESLINYNVKGDYLIVETINPQFTLRDGELATCIFNNALARPTYDTLSPKRQAKKGLGALFSKNKAG